MAAKVFALELVDDGLMVVANRIHDGGEILAGGGVIHRADASQVFFRKREGVRRWGIGVVVPFGVSREGFEDSEGQNTFDPS